MTNEYPWNLGELVKKLVSTAKSKSRYSNSKEHQLDANLFDEAASALSHMMNLNTELHRRVQLAEGALQSELDHHKNTSTWRYASSRQSFKRMMNAHDELQRIYDQFRKAVPDGCDNYGYHSVSDCAYTGGTVSGAVYANRYLSKNGGIVTVRIADLAEPIIEELLALRSTNTVCSTEELDDTLLDFGKIQKPGPDGTTSEYRMVVPGLTLHDIVMVFENAKNKAKSSDRVAGNPTVWPEVRGVKAIIATIIDALQKFNNGTKDDKI